jgi:putative DNA primase/helicase
MIQGAIKWNKQGLKRPESIMQSTNEYLSDEDGYSTWLNDNCVIGSGEKCAVNIAYKSFQAWCLNSGEYCPSQKRFMQRLVEKGYPKSKTGVLSFTGFSMKESESDNSYQYYS